MGTASVLLTDRQREVLEAFQADTAARGYPPTVRELGAALGLSSLSSVHEHLAALERKGWIVREAGSPRATRLTPTAQRLLAVHRLTEALDRFDWGAP
jgi:repressor LexA